MALDPKYKVGDRVLVEAIITEVRSPPTNWPVTIILDGGATHTIDVKGRVHSTAIRGVLPTTLDTMSLLSALAVLHYLDNRSDLAGVKLPLKSIEVNAYDLAIEVVATHAMSVLRKAAGGRLFLGLETDI